MVLDKARFLERQPLQNTPAVDQICSRYHHRYAHHFYCDYTSCFDSNSKNDNITPDDTKDFTMGIYINGSRDDYGD